MKNTIWVNTKKIPCAICLTPVEEVLDFGKSRTLKSWLYVCSKCWRDIEKRVSKVEKYLTNLNKKHKGRRSDSEIREERRLRY